MIQKTTRTIFIEYLRDTHEDNFVYHITSDYYKQSILDHGLRRQLEITQAQINDLDTLIQNANFVDLNISLNGGYWVQPIIERIKEAYQNVNQIEFPISATRDYMNIFDYLKEETKGGQYLKEIKKIIAGVEQKVTLDNNLMVYINQNVSNLMSFIDRINRSGFLLCKIDKTGFNDTGDENRFATTQEINANSITEIIEINKLL